MTSPIELAERLETGARDLHPYSLGDVESPSLDVALPAYLNEAAAYIRSSEEEMGTYRTALRIARGSIAGFTAACRQKGFADLAEVFNDTTNRINQALSLPMEERGVHSSAQEGASVPSGAGSTNVASGEARG